jgi:hypothetical protein
MAKTTREGKVIDTEVVYEMECDSCGTVFEYSWSDVHEAFTEDSDGRRYGLYVSCPSNNCDRGHKVNRQSFLRERRWFE